jgi:D-alanyl-D-alanine dipeptidase
MQDLSLPLVNVVRMSHELCQFKIECKLAYATKENFLGRIVDGYNANAAHIALVTPKTAEALCRVQDQMNQMNFGLIIFDSYRPLRAVRDFKRFMHEPIRDAYELERKKIHYPYIEKNQFATLGYIADVVSNHCFGDTVDLSLIDLSTGELMDMGACFDYFDEVSHATATAEQLGQAAFSNRKILTHAMQAEKFTPHAKEFWHYTFIDRDIVEPLDIEITADLE